MSKLVVVGTVAFDAIETPFGKTDKILGGAATFISLAAARCNADSAIVSVVGGDFPEEYLEMLKDRNINIDSVEVVPEGKTFYWKGKYHDNMNSRDTLVTELNVLESFKPNVPENYRDAEVVMLGNLHPAVQHQVIDQLDKPELIVLDTMNFWMDNAWDELTEVIQRVNVITINDEEARQLSGEYSLVTGAHKIMEMGPEVVIIKKGEHGALLFQDNEIFFAPALPLEEVFDPTGAGDTFAGGFTGYLARSGDYTYDNMKRALIYGSAYASFCVERFGTERLVNLTGGEIERRLRQFKSLTQYDIELT